MEDKPLNQFAYYFYLQNRIYLPYWADINLYYMGFIAYIIALGCAGGYFKGKQK